MMESGALGREVAGAARGTLLATGVEARELAEARETEAAFD